MSDYKVPAYRTMLVRDGHVKVSERPILSSPDAARDVLGAMFAGADRERFVAAFVDSKNRIIGVSAISEGTVDQCVVHPREVVKAAILMNAVGVIIAHNHPSGDPEPSPEDRRLTDSMAVALKTIDVSLLDHLIHGDGEGRWYSFRENGWRAR